MKRVTPSAALACALAAALAVVTLAPPAAAHQGGRLYLTVHAAKARVVDVIVTGRPIDFAPAIGGLRGAAPALYRLRAHEVTRYTSRYLVLDSERGKLCKLQQRALRSAERGKIVVALRYRCPRGKLRLRSDLFFGEDPYLRVFVTLQVGNGPPKLQLLNRSERTVQFEPPSSELGTALEFLWLGIEHIFGGYDHILFLLGLLLAAPLFAGEDPRAGRQARGAFKYMLKIVTAFTISHSITLALAATGSVRLPARFVEPAIAVSIIAVAVANILRPPGRARVAAVAASGSSSPSDSTTAATAAAAPSARPRVALVLGFGLVHGFGFASVLADTGLPARGAALALFSFNVGVEIGQLCAVIVLFPIVFRLARPPITLAASLLLMLLLGLFFGALTLGGIAVHFWPAVCAVLLVTALILLRRYRFEAVVLRGGSAIVAAFGLFWLLERVFNWHPFGGILG